MNTKTNDKAKSKPKAKAKRRVKLKPTTRAMLRRAHLMSVLLPVGRNAWAKCYREGRRCGRSNQYLCDINQPTWEEKMKLEDAKYEAECAKLDAAAAEQAKTNEPPADPAPREHSQTYQEQRPVIEEHAPTKSHTPTSRRRRPRVVPQKRQAEFSFGSE